jgi:hypothetical protein
MDGVLREFFIMLGSPTGWVIPVGMVLIAAFAVWLHFYTGGGERDVKRNGNDVDARITGVRVDEGDCIVTYEFVEPVSGKRFSRSGVYGFQVKTLPVVGGVISVRYRRKRPAWSRMLSEPSMRRGR